jgi:N-acetylmuramoyl-L-alanine amidase
MPRAAVPYSPQDLDVMARTLWGEARGEGPTGRIAVAWIIRNRVETDLGKDGKPDWWGEGIEGVCRKPWQFSCWNADDPNRPKLMAVTEADHNFRDCLEIARGVLAGIIEDPTGGATQYYNPRIVADAQIGQHMFFKYGK